MTEQSVPTPRRRGKRPGLRLTLFAAVLTVAAAVAWWALASGPEVEVVTVERGDAAQVVYATGFVEPLAWAKVTALQRKRIIDICKCEGRSVSKGDVLVRLDDAEERALLNELEARLDRLQADAERLKTLLERNAISRISLEEKLTEVREFEARVDAQKDRILDLELRSPVDGVVLRRDGEVGEVAGTGVNDVLLWVGQPKPLRIVAEVNEEDISRVASGQKALLRHEGFEDGVLRATVSNITPKGDPQTKTFRVYLALPNDTPLMIGMSVEANIVVREVSDATLVPADAVNGDSVLVEQDGRVAPRSVMSGLRGGRMIEIVDGLEPGEVVLSPFLPDLASGGRVRPVAAARQ